MLSSACKLIKPTVTQMKEKEKTVKEHPAAELLTIDIFRRLSKSRIVRAKGNFNLRHVTVVISQNNSYLFKLNGQVFFENYISVTSTRKCFRQCRNEEKHHALLSTITKETAVLPCEQ